MTRASGRCRRFACGCTSSELVVKGAPITCDTLGGEVDGTVIDPEGVDMMFGPVQVALEAPDVVAFSNGTLLLELGIGDPPRAANLSFPDPRTVFATDGILEIDDDTTCHAGRFDTVFLYHGEVTGWFAVAP